MSEFFCFCQQVSHDFAINFNPEDDECEGKIYQLVQLYADDTKMNICNLTPQLL